MRDCSCCSRAWAETAVTFQTPFAEDDRQSLFLREHLDRLSQLLHPGGSVTTGAIAALMCGNSKLSQEQDGGDKLLAPVRVASHEARRDRMY